MDQHTLIVTLIVLVVVLIFLKTLKYFFHFLGVVFLLITLALFLRSENIINFTVPDDLSLKSFHFSINDGNSEKIKKHIDQVKEKAQDLKAWKNAKEDEYDNNNDAINNDKNNNEHNKSLTKSDN